MASAQATRPPQSRPLWHVPLLVGICFGVGYGLTQRLLALQLPSLVRLGQGFDVRPFPGTSLESLRLRFGADSHEIRGDLDLLELEQQTKANKPADAPVTTPEARPADPALEAEPRLSEPEPQRNVEPAPAEAPPPPALPGTDAAPITPEAGPR